MILFDKNLNSNDLAKVKGKEIAMRIIQNTFK
jgi:hypothetical protein